MGSEKKKPSDKPDKAHKYGTRSQHGQGNLENWLETNEEKDKSELDMNDPAGSDDEGDKTMVVVKEQQGKSARDVEKEKEDAESETETRKRGKTDNAGAEPRKTTMRKQERAHQTGGQIA